MFQVLTRTAIVAVAMTLPVALHAQRGGGPRMGEGVRNPVAPLIDMRRELNLSGRQLAQLDSIERALLQRNEALRQQFRPRGDSARPAMRRQAQRDTAVMRARRDSMRVRMDSMRTLRQQIVRNDSTARAQALGILTDAQRAQVRERMAERRGFEAGRRSAVRGQTGPRMRGPGGRIGPDRPLRRGDGMRRPGAFAPRFDGRRPVPDDRPGMMGRGFRGRGGDPSANDSTLQRRRPMDTVAPRPGLRRPPND